MRKAVIAAIKRKRLAMGGGQTPSATFTTFTSNTATPETGATGAVTTFTLNDASDNPIEGRTVTYA